MNAYIFTEIREIIKTGGNVRYLTAILLIALTNSFGAKAQSNLLESVKSNPQEAKDLCIYFRSLNAKGISANSKQAIKQVSQKRNLNAIDAEILSTYVIGLNCPDVR